MRYKEYLREFTYFQEVSIASQPPPALMSLIQYSLRVTDPQITH